MRQHCLLFLLCLGVFRAQGAPTGDDNASSFSDTFVRSHFPIIFASTEAPNATNCLDKVFTNYELKRHVNVKCDEADGLDRCSGLTLVSHDDKAIIIAFRGTKGVLQLLVESDEIMYRNKTAWFGGGNVGFYFARSYNLLWNAGMKEDFNTLKHAYPGYEIWVGGHSLGGSMAALASNYLVANGLATSSNLKMITFGEPRTGDKAFADAHDKMVTYSYRIVHHKDIVPHIPLNGMAEFHHHRNEVWYDNDMLKAVFKECDAQESPFCSDSHLDYEIEDHHRYFGMFISFYGRRNCTGDPSN
ncbi:Fungal lipase-type domain-containing protein [Caenorhabditis elegans]|uniref:Fungal lipase-type domain-containing protein n=2 Tax=Caenorhabditis elegans TaxID=6239 RepID=O76409_CAEEL|nr:Fungal lipase-like domain-containing protein [Caenorhabditis elegans]CCD74227.1 Fungal lipase-like domain-containing protein [Caenorhabditis elegans]|eukprot:NP_503517.1 Uncharacterized protein CELE_T10B5.7 [Caenorhabditis elegans]